MKHSPISFLGKITLLIILCISFDSQILIAADETVEISARRIDINSEHVNDSIADLSGCEAISNDYRIRLRFTGDTLMDVTTNSMRCDLSVKGDTLLLCGLETGDEIENFARPINLSANDVFASVITPYAGLKWRSYGNSRRYVRRSMLINSDGDTLQTVMIKNLLISALYFPENNPVYGMISVTELRSYYVPGAALPTSVIVTKSTYDSDGTGIGESVYGIDLIDNVSPLHDDNLAMQRIKALSPAGGCDFKNEIQDSDNPDTTVPKIYITTENGHLNVAAARPDGVTASYTLMISDARGLVWHNGSFTGSTEIDLSPYPRGEYQITVSDGIHLHSEKLTI